MEPWLTTWIGKGEKIVEIVVTSSRYNVILGKGENLFEVGKCFFRHSAVVQEPGRSSNISFLETFFLFFRGDLRNIHPQYTYPHHGIFDCVGIFYWPVEQGR